MRRAIWKPALIAIVAFIMPFVAGASILQAQDLPQSLKSLHAIPGQHRAPSVTFLGQDGEALSLLNFRGRTVILNLWATWCAPCIKEMPALDLLAERLPHGRFVVVTVSQDVGGSVVARAFLERLKLENLTAYADPSGNIARSLGSRGLPTTFVISGEGYVVARIEGAVQWDDPEIVDFLLKTYAPD